MYKYHLVHTTDIVVVGVNNATSSTTTYRRIFYHGHVYGPEVERLQINKVYQRTGDDDILRYYITDKSNNADSLCQRLPDPFVYLHPNYTIWKILADDNNPLSCQPSQGNSTGVTKLTCLYNNDDNSITATRIMFGSGDDWQTTGYVHTCNKLLDLNTTVTSIRNLPSTLMFFNRWIFTGGYYMAISTNSLFGHQFIKYKFIERIELRFCVNKQGHVISGSTFIKEDNFRYSSDRNYRLLMVNISPFVYFGTIDLEGATHPPAVTCSFVLH